MLLHLKIYGILGGFLIGLLLLSAYLFERNKELREEKENVILFAKQDSAKLTTYYTNKLGEEVAKTQAIVLTSSDAKDLQNTEKLAFLSEFEGLNKRLNNLDVATRTTARLVAEFKIPLGDTTIIMPDSSRLKARNFDNHNEWIELKGTIFPDSVVIKPVVTVPLVSVDYWQRRKILFFRIGKKDWFHETTSKNPYVHITKNEVTRIKKK